MHKVLVDDEEFSAYTGDVLLDAALLNGIDIPYDCRAGQCGSCAVRVLEGRVHGGESGEPGTVKACQCRIVSDVHVVIEDVPEVASCAGRVSAITPLAPDVVEVRIEPSRPVSWLPGQYVQVRFRGFPARSYSPTVPLDGGSDERSIRLHVRCFPQGRVSSALGKEINEGHRVRLKGPFGSAYLRQGLRNRLVLVAGGTGFAPLWSITQAALDENPYRTIVLVAGARSLEALYMIPALCRLASYRNVTIIPVTQAPQSATDVILTGRPTDYVPPLSSRDVVYTAGSPKMVDAVAAMARSAGAVFHADAFVPGESGGSESLFQSLTRLGNATWSFPPWRRNLATQ